MLVKEGEKLPYDTALVVGIVDNWHKSLGESATKTARLFDKDNRRTRSSQTVEALEKLEEQTPLDLFQQLYELQNNQPMSGEQARFCAALMESIWEEKA